MKKSTSSTYWHSKQWSRDLRIEFRRPREKENNYLAGNKQKERETSSQARKEKQEDQLVFPGIEKGK